MALKLKFDLQDLLNSAEDRSTAKSLSAFVKKDFIKREFGERVIDEIKVRTQKGKDKRNNSFRGAKGQPRNTYSKRYQKSLAYRVWGKRSSPVTLKLSGQMQASMFAKVIPSGVEIRFRSRTQEKKARGHIMGSGKLPVRDFWGIPKKDQVKILKGVIKDFNAKEGFDELVGAFETLVGLSEGAALGETALELGAGAEAFETVQDILFDEGLDDSGG